MATAREENMMILKMLQEGTITAEQAAQLLSALDASEAKAAGVATVPPIPPVPPVPGENDEAGGEAFARARTRIAEARERVAGVQEQLSAAEERLSKAESTPSPNAWEGIADALKDVPGARSIADALRQVEPGRIAAAARRQARRVGRNLRAQLDDLNIDLNLNIGGGMHGEPTLAAPREATATVLPGGTLRVRNTLGDIEAVGAEVPEARVAGVLKIWSSDTVTAEQLAKEVQLVVEQGEDGPVISAKHPADVRRVQLNLKVFVPAETRISLLSPSGDVSAANLKSSVVLATQSGDARASEITGDIAVETASGDIAVEGITGNIFASTASGDVDALRLTAQIFKATTQSGDISLKASTTPTVTIEVVSGDVHLEDVTATTLRLRAVSGDVKAMDVLAGELFHVDSVSGGVVLGLRGPLKVGAVEVSTISGDGELRLPRHTDAQMTLSTKSGEIQIKVAGDEGGEKSLSGAGMVTFTETLGDGVGAKVQLSSVSGDLSVTQERGPVPTVMP